MFKTHKDGTQPKDDQVFVFGSNLAGIHGGGAAKAAKYHYGAEIGVAEGMTGNSYAIPTKDKAIANALPLDDIQASVTRFVDYAKANQDKQFFVTRIGCVLAGYTDAQIAPMFIGAPDNCSFAEEWADYIKPATSLVLRCCAADMSSRNGFIWPGVGGISTAPDWVDNSDCGNGLHGWLYGQGDHTTSRFINQADAKWLVVEVASNDIRMLGGKCKFPSGKVVFVGGKKEAADYIIEHEPNAKNVAVIGAVLECGDEGVLQGGALSVLTGGDSAKMTGGYYATMTGGDYATMTGGDYAKMTGGDSAKMTGGDYATMHFQYWDGKRQRTVVAYVGEDGIEANVAYKLDENHKPVKA